MGRTKVAIATIGCRSNQADSAKLVRHLDSRSIEVTTAFDGADIVVINTCCVTKEAERDCRKLTRRALGVSETVRVILFGCALSAVPDFGKDLGDRIELYGGGDTNPTELAARINEIAGKIHAPALHAPALVNGIPEKSLGRTRILLKIQTGCRHFCTYCIVPQARGKERSMPLDEVLEEALRLADDGIKEVVLTGVQLGAWGSDLPGRPLLADLIVKVADRVSPGRVRLSSIEPWSVDDALITAISEHDRICPHLHLPLQSGDDRVLGAMGRGYSVSDYLEIVHKTRERIPDVAIGTDVLLGFPGEDEAAFDNTVQTLEKIKPAYLHAFPYSARPDTLAATLPNRPIKKIAKERTRAVRKLQDDKTLRYRASHLDQVREIVVEEIRSNKVRGLTDTFVPVVLRAGGLNPGDLVRVRLKSIDEKGRLTAEQILDQV